MSKAKEYISKRMSLLIMFLALLGAKCAGFDGIISEAMLIVLGAIVGKEVLSK